MPSGIGEVSLPQGMPSQHLRGQQVWEMPALGSCWEREKPRVRMRQADSASLCGKMLFWLKRSRSPWGEQISNQYLTLFASLLMDEPFFPLFQSNTWLYFPFNELLDQSPKWIKAIGGRGRGTHDPNLCLFSLFLYKQKVHLSLLRLMSTKGLGALLLEWRVTCLAVYQ